MSGKKSQLTALETRKQLLLVESELNRAQLLNELRDLKNEIHHWHNLMCAISSVTAAAAKLADVFSAVGRAFSHRDEGDETPWISTLLNCAKAGTSLWRLFRSG